MALIKIQKHRSKSLNINLLEAVKMPESFFRGSKDIWYPMSTRDMKKWKEFSDVIAGHTCEDILLRLCLKISKVRKPPCQYRQLNIVKSSLKIEDEISDEDAKTRYKIRQEKARPILDEFFAWIENNINKTLPKSKLGKAFQYAQNQKEGLQRYLEHGHIAIYNIWLKTIFSHLRSDERTS